MRREGTCRSGPDARYIDERARSRARGCSFDACPLWAASWRRAPYRCRRCAGISVASEIMSVPFAERIRKHLRESHGIGRFRGQILMERLLTQQSEREARQCRGLRQQNERALATSSFGRGNKDRDGQKDARHIRMKMLDAPGALNINQATLYKITTPILVNLFQGPHRQMRFMACATALRPSISVRANRFFA